MTNTDAMVVDAVRELRARDEQEQAAVMTAMTALMQESQLLVAAMLAREGRRP
jgi:hypothetical protein